MASSKQGKGFAWLQALYSGGSSIWLPLIPYAVAIGSVFLAFQQYTAKVEAKAAAKTDQIWMKRIDEYDKASQARIDKLYAKSSELANAAIENTTKQRVATQRALKPIAENAKAGLYLEVKDGQCILKPEFVRAFNEVHNTLPGAKK